jgi:DNA repair protein RadC
MIFLSLEDRIERDREHFYVMQLDVRCQIKMVVSIGTLTSALVHPRETYRRAVVEGAASIIIAHNHPSGEADPSDDDLKITKQIFEAGQILWITMLDHIIFTKNDYYSFRANGKGWSL